MAQSLTRPARSLLPWLRGSIVLLLLQSCASDVDPTRQQLPEMSSEAEILLQQYRADNDAEQLFAAVELLLANNSPRLAQSALRELTSPAGLEAQQQQRYALLQALTAQQLGRDDDARRWLRSQLTADLDRSSDLGRRLTLLLAELQLNDGNAAEAFATLMRGQAPQSLVEREAQRLVDTTWLALRQIPPAELDAMASSASSYEQRGWIELARVVEAQSASLRAQLDAVEQWRRVWTNHPAVDRAPGSISQLQRLWDQRPRHIALILPIQQAAGLAIQEGFYSAYYEDLEANRDVPLVTLIDSSNAESAYSLYDEAVAAGAELIVGPLDKRLVNQLAALDSLSTEVLALNYADDQLDGLAAGTPDNFFQFGLAPEDEIRQITELAVSRDYDNSVLIIPASAEYQRLEELFDQQWRRAGGQRIATMAFSEREDYADSVKRLMAIDRSEERASRLRELLPRNSIEFIPRRRQDIDFIYLIANPREARQINPTLAFYFAQDIPVFAYPSIFDGALQSEANRDLDGIVFNDAPSLLRGADRQLGAALGASNGPLRRLRALGVDAYRLHFRISQFDSNPAATFSGVTGQLRMDDASRFRRELPLAVFQDGSVELLDAE